ncbi:MAG: hypothetical protein O2983_01305 [Planctomycetota bacterium]|nr:hypothetical protein [Planctomycetota bacterium]MDA0918230.1 hypothetical protein [Planctomycetota bacterium]MDA1158220.1 hypothetical protein [Planctomycetota bacterium]
MARSKLDKTLADYMAIAITPALIMLLTGSLVWFLAELGYDGGRPTRIRWILFWFVIGAVLVARIAIENGRAHAAMFLAGLAGATALTIFKFAPEAPLVPIICLGVVAWCADKLTWDCTLIDESEDASGEGLLQVAGVADEAELIDGDAVSSTDSADLSEKKSERKKVSFWKRLFVNESERAGKPHAPGLWVVYFSLAALPLYGFGQVWIPATDVASRHFAFQCLLVYVGAAFGLLLMTSFLGLRRYLRQRNIEMPTAMAATWIGMGSAIAIGILVVAMLLPRPQGDYSIAEAIDYVSEEVQEASDWAFLNDDGGEGEGQLNGPADEDAEKGSTADPDQQGKPGGEKPGNQVAQNDQQNAQDGDGGDQQGEGENGKQSGNQQGEGEPGESKQDAGQQTAQNDSQSSKSDPSGNEQQNSSGGEEQKDGQQSDQQSSQQTAQNKNSNNKQQNQSGEPSDNQSGDQQSDEKKSDDQLAQNDVEKSPDEAAEENAAEEAAENAGEKPGEEAAESEQAESTPESDSSWMDSIAENMGTLFKWLIYAAMVAGVIYLAIRNWPAVSRFLKKLWAELLSMFGRKPAPVAGDGEEAFDEPVAPLRPFSDFRDPFRSGKASQTSPGELVRYTFEALQAWAFENNCGRTPDQTPMEFGQRLQSQRLKISSEAHEVSLLYAQVAYGGLRPDDSNMATLQKLWRKLT